MKKYVSLVLLLSLILFSAGCSINSGINDDESKFKVAMVTDTGGVNDLSFNSSAWSGMSEFASQTGAVARYIESSQSSDYSVNIDKLADENCNLIWAIGLPLADVVKQAAKVNPELKYAIADCSYGDTTPQNVTGVVYRAEESAFVVGYIAGRSTKTDCVGFVGGIKTIVIDQFEYGFRAGVEYAAKELGKKIDVKAQSAESFSDAAKGKAIASVMFSSGCDIVMHAAGGAGVGVIEAAKESGNFAIGADLDQRHLAPNNVLTSAIKNVGKSVKIVSSKVMNGEDVGGQTLSFGLKEGCVGIPQENPNVDPKVIECVDKLERFIIEDKIVPPGSLESYNDFVKTYLN